MKNILAENMLRFRAKNLNESKFKRRFLKEQTDDNTEKIIVGLFTERSTKLWANIKPEEKTALMAKARLQIEKHAKLKGYDYNKSLNRVSNATIAGKSETITTPAPPPVVTLPRTYSAYYPNIAKIKDNPQLNNFYLEDNETRVSPENEKAFATLLAELKAEIPANETIQKIEILGGSSTSKVPTTIGGTVPKATGNIELANRRCAAIVATLESLVRATFKDYTGQLDKKFMPTPNIGAAYTQKEQTHFFGSGSLNPKFKAEYDTLYGQYKGSYGSILIETIATDPGKTTTYEPSETTVSNYKIVLGFKDMATPNKTKVRKGSNTGGGISVGGAQVIPICPLWK